MIHKFVSGKDKQTQLDGFRKTTSSLLKPVLSLFDQNVQRKNMKTKETINILVYNFAYFIDVI